MENIEIIYIVIIFALTGAFLIYDFIQRKKLYESGSYYKNTQVPFFSIGRNVGVYGEYLIYEALKYFELENAKFLFNLYIPTYNGKTTEIDAIMISQYGIFVFESKTYLRKLINKNIKIHSIVVFSDRCEFKGIKRRQDSKAHLIHRCNLYNTVNNICTETNICLTTKGIEDIYNLLYKYSQTDERAKIKHIENINKRF